METEINCTETVEGVIVRKVSSLDLEANCRVAANVARRELMPTTAQRQDEIADLIREARINRKRGQKIIIVCD